MIEAIPLSVWNVLIPLALALGLDFFLVVLAIGLLPMVPGMEDLPGHLELLSTPPVFAASAALYLSGWGMERHRFTLLFWQSANMVVRAVGASLLATLVVAEMGMLAQALAGLTVGALACGVQALRMGWGTVLDHGEGPIPRRPVRAAAEDALAAGALWVAVLSPPPWGVVAALGLLLPAFLTAGPAFRAAAFSIPLLRGVALSTGGGTGWTSPDRFPRWLRGSLARDNDPISFGLRGCRAALSGGGAIGRFRTGWLVISGSGPTFSFRTLTRVWDADLSDASLLTSERRSDLILLRFADGDRLVVPRGGPGLNAVRAEFGHREPLTRESGVYTFHPST